MCGTPFLEIIMNKLILATTLTVVASNAFAGSLLDAVEEQTVVVAPAVVVEESSSSSFLPVGPAAVGVGVLAIAAVALLANNDDGTNGTNGTN